MVQAKKFEPDTWLLVQGALYGLRESPHSWGVSRDSKLSKLQWSGYEGRSLELSQCEADVSMWRIRDKATHEVKGTIGVYVDDLLVLAEKKELKHVLDAIRGIWKCSDPAFATDPGGFTLCGVQVEQEGSDLFIHQKKYIGDLMQRYAHIKPTGQLPEFKQEPTEETPTPEKVQYAQKVIGELTWVGCRTTLDVAYVVNRLSRYAVGHPSFAAQCGEQILGYLFQTSEVRLRYGKCRPSEDMFENELPVPRTPLC